MSRNFGVKPPHDLLDVPEFQESEDRPTISDRLAGLCLAAVSGAIMGSAITAAVFAAVFL